MVTALLIGTESKWKYLHWIQAGIRIYCVHNRVAVYRLIRDSHFLRNFGTPGLLKCPSSPPHIHVAAMAKIWTTHRMPKDISMSNPLSWTSPEKIQLLKFNIFPHYPAIEYWMGKTALVKWWRENEWNWDLLETTWLILLTVSSFELSAIEWKPETAFYNVYLGQVLIRSSTRQNQEFFLKLWIFL